MRRFLDLKIATKLILGFVLVALIAGIVGAIGLVNINSINNADTQLYKRNTLGLQYIGNADVAFQRIRFNTMKILVDQDQREAYIEKAEGYMETVNQSLEAYNQIVFTEENRKLFAGLTENWNNFSLIIDLIIEKYNSNDNDQAKQILLTDAQEAGDVLQTSFDNLFNYNADAAKEKSDANDSKAAFSIILMLSVIIAGIIIAVILGLVISGIISKPIIKIVSAAEELAVGNIKLNIQSDRKDETGKLMEAFAKMIASIREQALATEKIADGDLTVEIEVRSENDLLGRKLSEMVEKNNIIMNNISAASEQVASGAKQISESSVALSQGATEQASSVEELTASLEQISSQTELNAQNAKQANQLAEVAKSNAIEGNTQMKDMQKAMEEINVSSSSISKIIKVIDDIAFQTNILALNAAVEAARAGQHGKGFAVVAEEVRNLAARSANAAKETTEMIESSIKKVEAGTKLANDTAAALNKIVDDVSRAAALVSSIADASSEQASGIAQINQGIMQVSQVVQTNSATSEEAAAASEELSSQADLLSETVNKFKIKKVSYLNNGYEMDPEVLKMLSSMSEKSKQNNERKQESTGEKEKQKIILSDKEFGKY